MKKSTGKLMKPFSCDWLATLRAVGLALLLAIPLTALGVEKVTYYHLDALGSPVAATDEQGNLKWREDYRPYGSRLRNEPAAASNTRYYTGHPHDEDTGLTYAGARYYDPVVGRFMAVDPVEFQETVIHSFNRYAYGNNNPYLYIDPDGEAASLLSLPAAEACLANPYCAYTVGAALGVSLACALHPSDCQQILSFAADDLRDLVTLSSSDKETKTTSASDGNEEDRKRVREQREKRDARRNKRGRERIGQGPHGQGRRDHASADKGKRGVRPKGPDRRHGRERNIGIDEEHSMTPKGPGNIH